MDKIDEILLTHEIYPNYKGYIYIKEIINNKKSLSLCNITDIYEDVAAIFGTTATAIERNVRYLAHRSNFGKVSNKLFLARLQMEYRNNLKGDKI